MKTLLAATLLLAAPSPVIDFVGATDFGGCSGSVVRTPASGANDPAFMLTNGHCFEGPGPVPDEVIVDKPASLPVDLLDSAGNKAGTLRTARAAYVTMSGTDIALYQVKETYAQIEKQYHVKALTLSAERAKPGIDIRVVSGALKQVFSCKLDGFAYRVLEATYMTKDVLRYTPECQTGPGSSGSPVIDAATGKVVGVNNTSNREGGTCTENNPCEMDRLGNISVRKGNAYGTQTYWITTCAEPGNRINLRRPGCLLPD